MRGWIQIIHLVGAGIRALLHLHGRRSQGLTVLVTGEDDVTVGQRSPPLLGSDCAYVAVTCRGRRRCYANHYVNRR